MSVKLWHDDVRPAPEGWVWARTNDEARSILSTQDVVEISMDHDLGAHEADPNDIRNLYIAGASEDNGYELVKWMVSNQCVPPMIRIHSWNPAGAKRMQNYLRDHGYLAPYVPYTMP